MYSFKLYSFYTSNDVSNILYCKWLFNWNFRSASYVRLILWVPLVIIASGQTVHILETSIETYKSFTVLYHTESLYKIQICATRALKLHTFEKLIIYIFVISLYKIIIKKYSMHFVHKLNYWIIDTCSLLLLNN